ncbi:hypothetical protein B0J13DRAFT_112640 [Dactylonectria estremocensis]|uniref:DUF7587 domain-containing protein n=1 Tax=Dactylonectria estremocensis TaxID=1079267 RepID=A0A9P9JAR8_9HYPO|nr:hypothetical protein B0J13DRAFT_112640 [Dactylonectria estremocensis]
MVLPAHLIQRNHIPSSVTVGTIPRYVFRVYNPKSAGETSTTRVASPAPECSREDIFVTLRRHPQEAFRRLLDHLNGYDDSHEEFCNFMSWTSSLLFALLYGIYQAEFTNNRYDDTKILILDTQYIKPGSFIKDIDILRLFDDSGAPRGFGSIHNFLKLRREYYFGEYLSQSEVDVLGHCAEASFWDLMNHGLEELYPWLFDASLEGKWAKREKDAREKYHKDDTLVTLDDAEKVIKIAENSFGGSWTTPMAAMILGLERRSPNDPNIASAFRNRGTLLGSLDVNISSTDMNGNNLPELESAGNVIAAIRVGDVSHQPVEELDELAHLDLDLASLALSDASHQDDTQDEKYVES